MYRMFYFLAIFVLVLFFRRIRNICKMRKEFSEAQRDINEFNQAYSQCEFFLDKSIDFEEEQDETILAKLNGSREFRITLSEEHYYRTVNTTEIRLFLMRLGKRILRTEEELKIQYGDLEYNHTYDQFRENYKSLRYNALALGEELL